MSLEYSAESAEYFAIVRNQFFLRNIQQAWFWNKFSNYFAKVSYFKHTIFINLRKAEFSRGIFGKLMKRVCSKYETLAKCFKKLMAQKLMKEVFDSYFEFGKLYPWTICHSNILGKKCNGNVMELCEVGSETTNFTVLVLFWVKFEWN